VIWPVVTLWIEARAVVTSVCVTVPEISYSTTTVKPVMVTWTLSGLAPVALYNRDAKLSVSKYDGLTCSISNVIKVTIVPSVVVTVVVV